MSTARCVAAHWRVLVETTKRASFATASKRSCCRSMATTGPPKKSMRACVGGPHRHGLTATPSWSRRSNEKDEEVKDDEGHCCHIRQGRRRQDDVDRRARRSACAERAECRGHRFRCRTAQPRPCDG